MIQLTLIALYGPKPKRLVELAVKIQEILVNMLGNSFRPYDQAQIHATIVGLERMNNSGIVNLNLAQYRKKTAEMDFEGLLNYLRQGARFPFQIQMGGFQNQEYTFRSQGQRPYDRSFLVINNRAVVVGWPVQGPSSLHDDPNAEGAKSESRTYTYSLAEIRRDVESFNILHKYHRSPDDFDNDFYFTIGLVDQRELGPAAQSILESVVRQYLSTIAPVVVNIDLSDIYLRTYKDGTLPINSASLWSVCNPEVTSEFVRELYDRD